MWLLHLPKASPSVQRNEMQGTQSPRQPPAFAQIARKERSCHIVNVVIEWLRRISGQESDTDALLLRRPLDLQGEVLEYAHQGVDLVGGTVPVLGGECVHGWGGGPILR